MIFLLAGLLMALVVLTGCSQLRKEEKGTAQIKNVVRVEIKDFQFIPKDIKIKKGTLVEWVNLDNTVHTATSINNFDSGKLEPGEKWSFTFNSVKNYTYACYFHAEMKGTIEVIE
jgi:plastocyanin